MADLTAATDDDERLVQWAITAAAAAEDTGVLLVEQAPKLHWRRGGDVPLSEAIGELYERTGRIDLFRFGSSVLPVDGVRYEAASVLAYYEPDGTIDEQPVSDLGDLLARLRPDAVDDGDLVMAHVAPVTLKGTLIDRRLPGESEWFGRPDRALVTFSLQSDIWFPWVKGLLGEDYDPDGWYDNRELAGRHTPRLNRFLDAVRKATEALGGTLALDEPPTTPGATDRGIDLSSRPG